MGKSERRTRQQANRSPSPSPQTSRTQADKEIKRLKFLTRISRQNIHQVSNFARESDLTKLKGNVIESKIVEISSSYDQYKEHVASLSQYLDDDAENEQFEEFTELDEMVSQCRIKLGSALTLEPQVPILTPKPSIIEARIPELNVPFFMSDTDEWSSFYPIFKSAVHDRTGLSQLAKFQYLRGYVKGKAYDIIKDFPLTEENYSAALELLIKRYDNPRQTIDRLIGAILDLPAIASESADALQNILDKSISAIKSLENVDHPLDKLSNVIVVRSLKSKLDDRSRELYESKASLYTFAEFQEFLETRIPILESIGKVKAKPISEKPKPVANRRNVVDSKKKAFVVTSPSANNLPPTTTLPSTSNSLACSLCQGGHYLSNCEQFKALKPSDRLAKAKELRLCINCLVTGHFVKNCTRSLCRICNQRHHTLLHFDSKQPVVTSTATPSVSNEPIITNVTTGGRHKVLPTASVIVQDAYGHEIAVCAMLDNCSTDNLVTEECARKLGLPFQPAADSITGLGGSQTPSSAIVEFQFRSQTSSYKSTVTAQVVNAITSLLPPVPIDQRLTKWVEQQNLPIADPDYARTKPVDMLLGVEESYEVLELIRLDIPNSKLKLVKTKLGWIVVGSWGQQPRRNIICNLSIQLERFWESEELPNEKLQSDEHRLVEEHFLATHSRHENGRFVVRLPFRANISSLSDCRQLALRKFCNLERKGISSEYSNFMQEYYSLNHMKKAEPLQPQAPAYYIPHFSVVSSNKFRVVFHASTKDANGLSLNDVMMTGPTLQSELFSILLRFRSFRYAFSTDVVKMYRQIAINPADYNFQRILWRDHPNERLEEYQLTTVTYGTSPASFLATRCLFRLAEEHEQFYPLACKAVRDQSYVDDILSGATTLEEAMEVKRQLVALLQHGCFELSKWRSNNHQLVDGPNPSVTTAIGDTKNSTYPTLGLNWNSSTDEFLFSKLDIEIPKMGKITKRIILSQTAKLYDPLGLISPIVLRGKMIFQQLWLTPCGWDDIVPKEEASAFRKFRLDLENIENLKIPRYLNSHDADQIELHVFGDASNRAYAAVAYLRIVRGSEILSSLLCSKTRVAPIKPITLARLELCASVLVARMLDRVAHDLNISKDSCFAYSDSQIVLAWLKKHPSSWACYVANRTAQIHALSSGENWRYIPSQYNPADVASRSCNVATLQTHDLWWRGPPILKEESSRSFTVPEAPLNEIEVEKRKTVLVVVTKSVGFENFSTYTKTLRVHAYVLRFVRNLRTAKENRIVGPILPAELEESLAYVVKGIQMDEYEVEYAHLEKNCALPKGNRLNSLAPFLDEKGIIRVGGRLENADISYDCRHPIIIPAKHYFTELIIKYNHKLHLHAGAQLTHNVIRQKFWLLGNARSVIRKIIRSCVTCTRFNGHATAPLMGFLPAERVNPSYPFEVTGVDYAGPLTIKVRGGRCRTTLKAYIAVFVCFSTKAVHIEVVESLSSEDFIAALRRFIGRRGVPRKMVSDNGTQFVGTCTELNELKTFLRQNEAAIADFASTQFIQWAFIPPHSPHMGGLWESAVRGMKRHLRPVIGNQVLTYAELNTLVIQVEACLNSRPIAPISNDPNDLSALTPGHFLIGRPLVALPSRPAKEVNLRQRWHLLQNTLASFWNRWVKEYLHLLTQRQKWRQSTDNLAVDDLVIVKEDNSAPMSWPLARVVKTYPGEDGHVRVVELRTRKGTIKRPVVKIIPLNIR